MERPAEPEAISPALLFYTGAKTAEQREQAKNSQITITGATAKD